MFAVYILSPLCDLHAYWSIFLCISVNYGPLFGSTSSSSSLFVCTHLPHHITLSCVMNSMRCWYIFCFCVCIDAKFYRLYVQDILPPKFKSMISYCGFILLYSILSDTSLKMLNMSTSLNFNVCIWTCVTSHRFCSIYWVWPCEQMEASFRTS